MRNQIATMVTACLLLAASCDGDLNRVDAVRRVINVSNIPVEVRVTTARDDISFALAPGDTIEYEGSCTYDEIRRCDLGWSGNAPSEVRFVTDTATFVWQHDFDTEFPDSVRALGADPQFEKYGYEGVRIDDVILYTFRIMQSDIL